jgi:hypothetical protein
LRIRGSPLTPSEAERHRCGGAPGIAPAPLPLGVRLSRARHVIALSRLSARMRMRMHFLIILPASSPLPPRSSPLPPRFAETVSLLLPASQKRSPSCGSCSRRRSAADTGGRQAAFPSRWCRRPPRARPPATAVAPASAGGVPQRAAPEAAGPEIAGAGGIRGSRGREGGLGLPPGRRREGHAARRTPPAPDPHGLAPPGIRPLARCSGDGIQGSAPPRASGPPGRRRRGPGRARAARRPPPGPAFRVLGIRPDRPSGPPGRLATAVVPAGL